MERVAVAAVVVKEEMMVVVETATIMGLGDHVNTCLVPAA